MEHLMDDGERDGRYNVAFDIAIDGHGDALAVRELAINESLNALPVASVHAHGDGPAPRAHDLLRKNCHIEVNRDGRMRHFHGIVWQARIREEAYGYGLRLQIVTAAHVLDQIIDTYMYQERTVPEIVEDVFTRHLGSSQRRIERGSLQRTYPKRDYTLQYQESAFNFIARLCEEEGIFFFFDHDAQGQSFEVLVLAETSAGLPRARTQSGGGVPYSGDADPAPGREVVMHAEHVESAGATQVVVGGYDRTQTGLTIRETGTERGAIQPHVQVYDHVDAVEIHDYQQPRYMQNTARPQADMRADLLHLTRQYWTSCTRTIRPARTPSSSTIPTGA